MQSFLLSTASQNEISAYDNKVVFFIVVVFIIFGVKSIYRSANL